jgi:hypothetical protein
MKEEILSIASDLKEGFITSQEAKNMLLELFGVTESVCDGNSCVCSLQEFKKKILIHPNNNRFFNFFLFIE